MYQLISKGMGKLIKTFYENKKKSLYFREIKRLTNLSQPALLNALQKLLKSNILLIKKTKSNTFYKINPKSAYLPNLFTGLDIKKFEQLDINIQQPLKEIINSLSILPVCIIFFGSASRNKHKERSDLDLLFIINKHNAKIKVHIKENVQKINAHSIYPITPFFCSLDNFKLNLKLEEDKIIVQAVETGFPIMGFDAYYKVVLNV